MKLDEKIEACQKRIAELLHYHRSEITITRLHLQGKVARRAIVLFKNQHCAKSKTHIVHNVGFKI